MRLPFYNVGIVLLKKMVGCIKKVSEVSRDEVINIRFIDGKCIVRVEDIKHERN